MSKYRVNLGKYGERLAAHFLERRGYQIKERNFYTAWGELDLIVQKDDEILFIEVKTRSSNKYGFPEEAVGSKKVSHLLKAIGQYLNRQKSELFWRLDAISIEVDETNKQAKIRWFKDVGRGY